MDDLTRADLRQILSSEEKARAARFRLDEHGHHFVVAHGQLRRQLAGLLHADPAALTFEAGAHGKPRLAGRHASAGLEFNLSHSGAQGLLGWAWGRAIGVDMEFWRSMSDEAALVRRYFSASEIAAYELLAPSLRSAAFFNGWTRKEAYVKAVGRGLGLPLHSFDVSLGDGAARLLRQSAIGDDGRSWSLGALQLGSGVSAAVVLEGGEFRIEPG